MAGKGLNELGLTQESLPAQSFDDLPEVGGFTLPPQPGPYRFQLPANLGKIWEPVETKKGQRVRAIFDKDAPLLIVASPGGRATNDSFQTRLTNVERKRGKEGVEASDLDYLLKVLGERIRPATNKAYGDALITYAGKEFGADITYSWSCNPEREIYAPDAEGKLQKVDGVKGCGKKYYLRDVQKTEEGVYPHEITCSGEGCGAVIRCFANLENFRA